MSSSSKIWLSKPHMGEHELQYVQDAFASNWIAPQGPAIRDFEKKLEQFTGIRHAVATASGTASLHVALIMLGVGPRDIVICQSNTFVATANPIVYTGATPVFVDSEPDSWNMDPQSLKEAITDLQQKGLESRIKAIIPVHLYGMPAKMDEILAIAGQYGIPVIEDAAEALGSVYHGKKCGALGDMGVLSFNGNKIITTSGGGALLTNSIEYSDRAHFLITQARDAAIHYQHSSLGYNYRLSNISAAIGVGQMEVISDRVEQRRQNFMAYQEYFKKWEAEGLSVEFQHEDPKSFSNRWLTAILINPDKCNGLTTTDLLASFGKENIETRPLWKPMHLQPLYRKSPYYGGTVSEKLFTQGLCLPSSSNLTEEEFERIFAVLDNALIQNRNKIQAFAS